MKVFALLFLAAACLASPDPRQMTCDECVEEMHRMSFIVKLKAREIEQYLTANYCPTLPEDSHACDHDISRWYVGMLYSVVEHFFVDGAVHVCQTMGVCDAREYTCEECVEGLEWVEAYLEGPVMIAEFTVYLQQNFCTSNMRGCHEAVAIHFAPMHDMAMEKFFIPTEICNQEPVCTGEEPTKPSI